MVDPTAADASVCLPLARLQQAAWLAGNNTVTSGGV